MNMLSIFLWLLNILLWGVGIGVLILFVMVLLKLNKALTIWLAQNKKK